MGSSQAAHLFPSIQRISSSSAVFKLRDRSRLVQWPEKRRWRCSKGRRMRSADFFPLPSCHELYLYIYCPLSQLGTTC
ncbi:hypothetical protein ERO13_D05G228401v2 [Gossypium hirsutum]|nr:hypothetical protein ERO13_D05G228401v2 [Gossypium hirsutum]